MLTITGHGTVGKDEIAVSPEVHGNVSVQLGEETPRHPGVHGGGTQINHL